MKTSPSIKFYRETEFKETPIGKVPEDWEVVRLKDIAREFMSGGTPSTKESKYWNGDIPWIRSVHITTYYINEDSVKQYITEEGLRNSAAKIIPKDNVIIATRVGIGKTAVNLIDVAINQDLTGVIIDRSKVNPFFIVWYCHLPRVTRSFEAVARGTTIKGIPQEYLRNLHIPLPALEEQKAIAYIISTVDEAILKTDEVIAKTERLKKGLMQQLLTKGIGHKEFKETPIGKIPEDWEVVKLGDVLELCQYGLSIKMGDEGKYPIVRMDEIENGYVISNISKRVNLDEKTFKAFKLEKGDILFNRTNSYELVGRTGIFLLDGDYVFASYLIRLRVKRNIIDPHFLTFYLIFSHNRLRQLATKAVHQANINATNLKKFKIPIPPLDEQQKIAKILSTVDRKLEVERKRREKLEKVKRGLMDLLLTGKIRVMI